MDSRYPAGNLCQTGKGYSTPTLAPWLIAGVSIPK